MIKVIGIVIISLTVIVLLKQYNSNFALLVTICIVLLIFTLSIDNINIILSKLQAISDNFEYMGGYLELLVKILGISLAAQLTSDLCRDSGENALASQTEIFAKIAILVMTVPLFETMMNIVTGLLK